MRWDGRNLLPDHMREGPALKFSFQVGHGGLTVRFVRCECDRDCHTYAVMVAPEGEDRWYPAYQTERGDWSLEKAWEAVWEALEDPSGRMAAVRACALFGRPWAALDFRQVVRLTAMVMDAPPWLHDEIADRSATELRELARWVVDDVVAGLALCRWARRSVA